MRRRRPLMATAMLGGAVMAGRASQRSSDREASQEQRLEQLEDQQAAAPAAAVPASPAAAPAAAGAGPSLTDQLAQLSSLKESGALTDEEFEAAKRKLLAS